MLDYETLFARFRDDPSSAAIFAETLLTTTNLGYANWQKADANAFFLECIDYTVHFCSFPYSAHSVGRCGELTLSSVKSDTAIAVNLYNKRVVSGLVEAILKTQAKNASCPDCDDTGLRDTGGIQPWGEGIFDACQCKSENAELLLVPRSLLEWAQQNVDCIEDEGERKRVSAELDKVLATKAAPCLQDLVEARVEDDIDAFRERWVKDTERLKQLEDVIAEMSTKLGSTASDSRALIHDNWVQEGVILHATRLAENIKRDVSELPQTDSSINKTLSSLSENVDALLQVLSISAQRLLKGLPTKDWVEDFHGENGTYNNMCAICKSTFIGHKRRVVCKTCAGNCTHERSATSFIGAITGTGWTCSDCGVPLHTKP